MFCIALYCIAGHKISGPRRLPVDDLLTLTVLPSGLGSGTRSPVAPFLVAIHRHPNGRLMKHRARHRKPLASCPNLLFQQTCSRQRAEPVCVCARVCTSQVVICSKLT